MKTGERRRMGDRKGGKRGKESENGRKEKDGGEERWEKGEGE